MSQLSIASLLDRIARLEQENQGLKSQIARMHLSEAGTNAALLTTIAQIAKLLLRAQDYTTVLPEVVQLLGEAVGSDRCTVVQDEIIAGTTISVRAIAEWCRMGVLSAIDIHPEFKEGVEPFTEIYRSLLRGKSVNILVSDLAEPVRSFMAQQSITSLLLVPILVQGQSWGHFAFDNCGEPRLYDEAEIAILQVAAESLAVAIERQAKDDELRESEHRYRTLFELNSEGIMRFGYKQPIPVDLSVDEQLDLCYQSIYIAEANNTLAQMYGREAGEELIGLTLNDFHDHNSEVTQTTMRDWINNRYRCHQLETVELDRHGRKRYFLNSSVSTIENDCVTSTWVSQVDITELREAQQALLEAEQKRSQELERLNSELQQTLDRLQAREQLLETSAIAAKNLLTREDFDEAINAALQIIGTSLDTDRVTVIEFFQHPFTPLPHWRVLYEWDSPGTLSQIAHPDLAQGTHEGMEDPYDQLRQGQTVSCFLDELPEPFRSEQALLGAKQLYEIPIFVEGKLWGIIGFDDCREAAQRSLAELSVLKIAANCIGSAIQQQRTQKAILQAEQERSAGLAKANQVLRRTASQLVGQEDLDRFLESVIFEVAQETEAVNNSVFFYNPQTNTLLMHSTIQEGQVINIETDPQFELWRTPVPADISKGWEQTRSRGYVWHSIESDTMTGDEIWDISLPWHRMMGHRFVISVLLQVGDEPMGFMGLCFREQMHLSAERIELVQALAHQAALAIQLTRLADESKQAAILEDRNRMAREIHDTLAQSFAGILMQLQAATLNLIDDPEQVIVHLKRASSLTQEGLTEARRSVSLLLQEDTAYSDLLSSLHQLVEQMGCNTDVPISVNVEGTPYPLNPEVGMHLFRIVQESLNNALRHAHPTTIQISLSYTTQKVSLCIQDDGHGFDLEQPTNGFGLKGMQQRADLLNAQLRINSQIGIGTEVHITAPTHPS